MWNSDMVEKTLLTVRDEAVKFRQPMGHLDSAAVRLTGK